MLGARAPLPYRSHPRAELKLRRLKSRAAPIPPQQQLSRKKHHRSGSLRVITPAGIAWLGHGVTAAVSYSQPSPSMSEVGSPAREHPSRVVARTGRHESRPSVLSGAGDWDVRSAGALVLVVLISTIIMIIYHNRFWSPADEGMYAHVAERVLR